MPRMREPLPLLTSTFHHIVKPSPQPDMVPSVDEGVAAGKHQMHEDIWAVVWDLILNFPRTSYIPKNQRAK